MACFLLDDPSPYPLEPLQTAQSCNVFTGTIEEREIDPSLIQLSPHRSSPQARPPPCDIPIDPVLGPTAQTISDSEQVKDTITVRHDQRTPHGSGCETTVKIPNNPPSSRGNSEHSSHQAQRTQFSAYQWPAAEEHVNTPQDDVGLAKAALVAPVKTSDGKFCCPVCKKTYTIWSYFKDHLLKHTGESPFYCKVCDRYFAKDTHLSQHKQRSKCEVVRGDAGRHTATVMPGDSDNTDKCPSQAQGSPSQTLVDASLHWAGELPDVSIVVSELDYESTDRTSTQPISGLDSPTNYDMKLVKEAYENPTKDKNGLYICPLSGRRCQATPVELKGNFKKHLRRHTRKHRVNCEGCGKTYKEPADLAYHKRTKHPLGQSANESRAGNLNLSPSFSEGDSCLPHKSPDCQDSNRHLVEGNLYASQTYVEHPQSLVKDETFIGNSVVCQPLHKSPRHDGRPEPVYGSDQAFSETDAPIASGQDSTLQVNPVVDSRRYQADLEAFQVQIQLLQEVISQQQRQYQEDIMKWKNSKPSLSLGIWKAAVRTAWGSARTWNRASQRLRAAPRNVWRMAVSRFSRRRYSRRGIK